MNLPFTCELSNYDGKRKLRLGDAPAPGNAKPLSRLNHAATTLRPSRSTEIQSSERYVIPNLRNACRILKFLSTGTEGFKVADISRALDIPLTTTLRIMATLHLEGLVRRNGAHHELGPVLIQLGNASLAGTEIRESALPVLESLTARTDETSHLAVPCDERSLIVAVQDGPHPLRAASRPGFLADLHCSSTGKIFLSYLYADRVDEIFAKTQPQSRTTHTLTTLPKLKREIKTTVSRGFSLDNEEFNPGVRCLAAPVYSSDGAVVAAIGITASTVRFTEDRVPEIARVVQSAAAELSERMGFGGTNT
jgi:DNA-binding IclR family transcriptional regulator